MRLRLIVFEKAALPCAGIIIMKKNDLIEITVSDISVSGEGIGKVDGYTFFVKDAIIGDTVRAVITKMNKGYGFAKTLEVVSPSDIRVEPKCKEARRCGGCQIQCMSYQAQLDFKRKKVRDNLVRIGGFKNVKVNETVGMEEPFLYRNKAQYPVGRNKDGRIIYGFYAGRTHSIIETDSCFLGPAGAEKILNTIVLWMEKYNVEPYDEEAASGLVRHVLIRKSRSGEFMVCLVINGQRLKYADELAAALPFVSSISYNIQTAKGNTILGSETVTIYGKPYITDELGGLKFRISPRSFYQVNRTQTEKLYSAALEAANLKGDETVWDLYCGIGTISLFMAAKAKKVIGVEAVFEAVCDARENARLNNIENASFICGRAEEIVPQMIEAGAQGSAEKNIVVVDPPRKGCDEKLLLAILKIAPEKIVYVSCNPATLARDLKILCEKDYRLESVCPVDMFPQTVSVETVCLLCVNGDGSL